MYQEAVAATVRRVREPNTQHDGHREPPLHCAAIWGNADAMRLLLEAGAAVDAKDDDG